MTSAGPEHEPAPRGASPRSDGPSPNWGWILGIAAVVVFGQLNIDTGTSTGESVLGYRLGAAFAAALLGWVVYRFATRKPRTTPSASVRPHQAPPGSLAAVAAQAEVCARFGVEPQHPDPLTKVEVATNISGSVVPLNGLRHPDAGDTSGWYLWRGESLNAEPGFFAPLHVEHVGDRSPEAVPYLALPPGWRFLIADGYEDVWFDPALIDDPA